MEYKPSKITISTLVKNKDLLKKVENNITYYSINFEDDDE